MVPYNLAWITVIWLKNNVMWSVYVEVIMWHMYCKVKSGIEVFKCV